MAKKFDPMNQKSEERPQCPEDARASGYDNNHPMDWVRGKNEDACESAGSRASGIERRGTSRKTNRAHGLAGRARPRQNKQIRQRPQPR